MNMLKRMWSFSIALLAFCFVISATLSSCGSEDSTTKASAKESTVEEGNAEHPSDDEGEHPEGDTNEHPTDDSSEHPEGEDHDHEHPEGEEHDHEHPDGEGDEHPE